MCENLRFLPGGDIWPCHRCWQCRRDRVDSWVGRCIAESRTANHTIVGTLTYGTDSRYSGADHRNAHVLFYSDVQRWLKRVRKATEGRVRFFVAGEYGSKHGRAHWHVLLFCEHLPPNVRYRERYVHKSHRGRPLWPHGWSYWDQASPESIRYVAKYVLKARDDAYQSIYRASTMPLLGMEYFRQQALAAVKQGLPPRLRYRFGDDGSIRGKPKEYRLSNTAALYYLAEYGKLWKELWGNEEWPWSEAMDTYCDVQAGKIGWDPVALLRKWELQCSERDSRWIYGLDGGVRGRDLISLWSRPNLVTPGLGDVYRRMSQGA